MQRKYLPPVFIPFVFTVFFAFLQLLVTAQVVQIAANANSSGSVVIGGNFYHVSEHIYTEAEIGAANFTTSATSIDHIDFNVAALGTITTVNNFRLYLKEVPLTTTTFTAGVYTTTGYTKVFDGTYNANTTGWVGVDLTTSFIRTSGNNLQLLIERVDNVNHGAAYAFKTANGNNTSSAALSCRRFNSSAPPTPGVTTLPTTTNFRAAIQFRHVSAVDAAVLNVYTLGKLPVPFGTPHAINANIINYGATPLTNLGVTLNVTGANSFTNVQTIPSLAPGASANVTFAAFSPVNLGANTVTVSVPADDFVADNSISVPQLITNNVYTYAYGADASGSVGVGNSGNPQTGDLVAKFTTSAPTSVNQVGVNFIAAGIPFKIGIWDKSGNGVPGTLLWESELQSTTPGVFTLPVSPPVPVTDTFYVGVRQTTTTIVQFAYQSETPIRPNTFFFAQPTGSTTWTDFATTGSAFRFMIEPRLTIANDVGVSFINNPPFAGAVDNCGLIPQATVTNYGSSDQTTPFDITFNIRQAGATVYTNTQSVALNSGVSQDLFFAPFTGSVSGADSSYVFTSLATDGSTGNDTIVNAFTTGNYSYGDGTGPNTGGYMFANSTTCASPSPFHPVYNWVPETSMTEINWGPNGDDSVRVDSILLPFSFPFFGAEYNYLWVSSNGWVALSDPTPFPKNVQKLPANIPAIGGLGNYIAGMLTDLDMTTAVFSDAHTYFGGDATQFVITYKHAHLKGGDPGDFITFQIILKPDGNIFIQYNNAETTNPVPASLTNTSTVGIENFTGTAGILYRRNGNGGPTLGSGLPLVVQFKPPVPSPVTLVDFNARRNGKTNLVSWSTSQELNTSHFIVERSSDGRSFSQIGRLAARGNTTLAQAYSFKDNIPGKGINYYRLRIVDFDSKQKYSQVRSIKNEGGTRVLLFTNPVRETMKVDISSEKKDKGAITITDMSGKQVYSKQLSFNAGINNFSADLGNLSSGTYIIKIALSDETIIKKVNKL